MSSPVDGGTLLALAREVGLEAAEFVRRSRPVGRVGVADTKSSPTDVVTEIDRGSEALIRTRILDRRPADGFVGEEGSDRRGTSGVDWIVDPIDGTVNFVYGIPAYAVSVAAQVEGRSVAGVVVNAATGVRYAAALGHGATRDGKPIRVRPVAPVSERMLLTGFGYEARQRAVQGEAVARILPKVRDIRRGGSAALDLCALASGSADAYVEEGLQLWDHAAGELIAREAGATVTFELGIGGRPCLIAAPADGHAEILALARECGFLARR